jgi:hypothetical protein
MMLLSILKTNMDDGEELESSRRSSFAQSWQPFLQKVLADCLLVAGWFTASLPMDVAVGTMLRWGTFPLPFSRLEPVSANVEAIDVGYAFVQSSSSEIGYQHCLIGQTFACK